MRKYLFLLMATAVLAGCEKSPSSPKFKERKDIVLTKSQKEVFSNSNTFAFNLLKEIYPHNTQQEVFISPLSMSSALSMLSNGASGETFNEIAKTLGYENSSVKDINSAYKAIIAGLREVDNSSVFAISNGLWLNSGIGFSVLPTFASALKNNYDASAEDLDFSSSEALERINSWTAEKTNQMIPEFFEELDPGWLFILANALYFKGIWTTKFPKSGTKPKPFHSLGGKDITKDFMEAELPCKLGYSTELKAKMCELPFGNKAFVFNILLPDENTDFDAFVAGLNAEKWNSTISQLSSQEDLLVSIPKMDLSFTAERDILIPALQSLGIVSAFNASADFSAMSNIAVFIDNVIQKTRFRMDEDGAEAAAVTVITGRNLASGEPFIANHPFVYAIREISTNTILFLGAYRGLE